MFPHLFAPELSILNGVHVPPGVALSCSVLFGDQPRKEFARECEFFSGPPLLINDDNLATLGFLNLIKF